MLFRSKGMETLVAGSIAPDISMKDPAGNLFELNKFKSHGKYLVLLFWSAGCSHCMETVDAFYPWQQQPELKDSISVLAISLDETDTEVPAWEKKIKELGGWKHLRAEEGVRSKVAADYYVLATPVMVVLDPKTRKIIATPNTLNELLKVLQ